MIREVLTLDALQAMGPADAAALLAARRADGAGDLDAEMLAAWLALSPANAQAWARTQAALAVFDDAEDDDLLDAMRQAARTAGPAAKTASRPRRLSWAVAAVLLVLFGGALTATFLANRPGGPTPGTVVAQGPGAWSNTFAAAQGPPARYNLPDGSHLTLEGGSTVEVAYLAARRDLRLVRGRAHFDVAHDRTRPFTVRAGDQAVVAVGTRFDVRLDPGHVRVVLTEGRVAVSRAGAEAAPVMLAAGQQLDAVAGRAPVVSPADLAAAQDWQDGFLTFDDTPLADAIADFNRTSVDQFVIRDPKVARLRITGRFQTGDAGRFGRTLAAVHPVRIVEIGPHRFEIVAAR